MIRDKKNFWELFFEYAKEHLLATFLFILVIGWVTISIFDNLWRIFQ